MNMKQNILISTALNIFAIVTIAKSAQLPQDSPPAKSLIKEPTIRIQCLPNFMLITIKDAPAGYENGLFSGMIYPKGLSKNSSCLTEYRNQDGPLKYKLPLRSCNTMPQEKDDGGFEFFNTIVLQAHLKLVTDLGRGYHVRCRYKNRDATNTIISSHKRKVGSPEALVADNKDTNDDDVVDRRAHGRSLNGDQIDDIAENKFSFPVCHMRIYSGDNVAENVKIGDPLTLKILIDKQDTYGLYVTDCLVRDGLGWGEQKLVNSEGCPVDGEIMGTFAYSEDRSNASVSFPAHKFPYTASVYYQCNVKLCPLKNPECYTVPNCVTNKRTKRDTIGNDSSEDEGQPATIQVYSGLYVNENAEILDNDQDSVFAEKSPDDALCVSQRTFAISIAIAGLCLMLAVVIAVLCIFARRRHKTISNSGSSIYSGPYTNTAMSHSS